MMSGVLHVHAPGRVNLVGDHTDYAGGRAMPMAIDLGITLECEPLEAVVDLVSTAVEGRAVVPLDVVDPAAAVPVWARYVAGVIAELRPTRGLRGTFRTTLPMGVGLSSSAALEIAVALALGAGHEHGPLAVAQLCRRAERRGSGVPCGLMDQLTCVAGVEGHALAIDFGTETWSAIALPDSLAVHVLPSGVERALMSSAYAERQRACAAAAAEIGPLGRATVHDVARIANATIRRRARHVVTENARVDAMADAFAARDLDAAGEILLASHRSLRDEFEVSVPQLDALVDRLAATPGVYGARLTGAGFGGCAVAFAEPDADLTAFGGWRVRPSRGASIRTGGTGSVTAARAGS